MHRPMAVVFTLFSAVAAVSSADCLRTSTETGGAHATPPPLLWDADSEARVVLATFCCDSPT